MNKNRLFTMTTTDTEHFSNFFVNIFDSLFNFFSKLQKHARYGAESFDRRTNLNAYIVTTLLLLLLIKKTWPKRKFNTGKLSYCDTLPYIQRVPFVKLLFLDGIIFWYKACKEGNKALEDAVKKYGTICRISLGFGTAVLVSDPDLTQKLLNSANIGHANKPQDFYTRLLTNVLRDGLLATKLDTWSHHRSVLAPAFKYKALSTYFKFINDEARSLSQSACKAVAQTTSGVISMQTISALVDHHAVKIITQIIMGSESFNCSDERMILFHENFTKIKEITVERFHRPEQMIPVTWWLHPNKAKLDQASKGYVEFVNQITDNFKIKEKKSLKKNVDEDELGIKPFECLIELMIKAGLSNKEITDEVATILAAGHDTVKVAIDFLIFHLACHQEYQEKCRAEVDELFNSSDGSATKRNLNMDDFSKLKYLEMCTLESMRLSPTVPGVLRELQEPLEIDDKYIIPSGEFVFVCMITLHKNPDVYPNPETYDPDRFLPENVKKRHPGAFAPFLLGMRNCIGWKIALLEIKVIMAQILRNFEMYTTDKPEDVKVLFDVIAKPERPYNVMFKKRIAKP